MNDIPRVFVGYDPREAVAYHVCVNSIIRHASGPVSITAVALATLRGYTEQHTDGSNEFIYSRFLVPWMCGFNGQALFLDGDMIVRGDVYDLFRYPQTYRGAYVVKHEYKTKYPVKYLGNKNEDYPRKNWSSVVLWNCGFMPNRRLTPEFVTKQPGSYLHRFEWLNDAQIGDLGAEWNHLVLEQKPNPDAELLHYTVGTPCFDGFDRQEHAGEWYDELARTVNVQGQSPEFILKRLTEV